MEHWHLFLGLILSIKHCIAEAPLYGTRNSVYAIQDEYVVVFKDQMQLDAVQSVHMMSTLWGAQNQELEVMKEFHIHNLHAVHVRTNDLTLNSLRQMSDVLFVETNTKLSFHLNATTEEPQVSTDKGIQCSSQKSGSELWGLSRINSRPKPNYSAAQYEYSDIDDGTGVEIYIIDSGIYLEHTDFGGRAIYGMTSSSHTGEGGSDLNGHGTHVAAIAGGSQYGVAKNSTLISVKVLGADGWGSVADVIEGIQWIVKREADKGPGSRSVVNLSLGSGGVIYSLEAVIQAAVDAGIAFVVAAGNNQGDACEFSPARISSVFTVGATTTDDKLASFSNYGPCVNLLAPGNDIKSASIGNPSSSVFLSGTSQAAPHVSGVLARHFSSLTEGVLTPAQLMSYAIDTATLGIVSLDDEARQSTPNRLLYRLCDGLPAEGSWPNKSQSWRTMPLGLAHLFTLLTVVCVILH